MAACLTVRTMQHCNVHRVVPKDFQLHLADRRVNKHDQEQQNITLLMCSMVISIRNTKYTLNNCADIHIHIHIHIRLLCLAADAGYINTVR